METIFNDGLFNFAQRFVFFFIVILLVNKIQNSWQLVKYNGQGIHRLHFTYQ